ncbi:MAG: phosphotransferase [Candidatus Paceibacterota bacterium]
MENPEHQNNTEKPASTHKTKMEQESAVSFLEMFYNEPVFNVETIAGGEGSQAFGYESNGEPLILRVNRHSDEGFKKDEYAFKNFESAEILIPEIREVGHTEDGQYFAISEKAEGIMFKNVTDEEFDVALPSLFETLNAIHAINISDKEGYGKWNSEGVADKESWKEVMLSVDMYAIYMFESTFLEKDLWDKVYGRLTELLSYCPDEKHLVHGDYTFDNLITKNGKITGVLDWADSMYGDPLYDIACISFWAKDFDYEKAYLKFSESMGKKIENFDERILCYKLYIGLSTLSFYAYSNQKDKYEHSKNKLLNLIHQ